MQAEIQRDHDLGDDIIQKLHETGQEVKVWSALLYSVRHLWTDLNTTIKVKFDRELKSRLESADRRLWEDKDLTRPYEEAKRRAEQCAQYDQNLIRKELGQIEAVVEAIREVHEQKVTAAFTNLPIVERQDILRDISSRYVASLQDLRCIAFGEEEVIRVAASYCYVHDLREYNSNHIFQNQGTRLAIFVLRGHILIRSVLVFRMTWPFVNCRVSKPRAK